MQVGGYTTNTIQDTTGTSKVDDSWALRLAVPIGGASDLTKATLDGLANGAELSFTWSRFGFRGAGAGIRSEAFREIMREARDRCLASIESAVAVLATAAIEAADAELAARRRFGFSPVLDLDEVRAAMLKGARDAAAKLDLAPPGPIVELMIEAMAEKLPAQVQTREELESALTRLSSEAQAAIRAKLAVATEKDAPGPIRFWLLRDRYCHAVKDRLSEDGDFAKAYARPPISRINRIYRAPMWRYGATGSVGLAQFKFIDSASLSERAPNKPQFKVAAFGAWYGADGVSAVLLGAEYQNAFEAAEDALVCKPVVVDPEEDCTTGAPTPPANIERVNLSVEYRRIFDGGWGAGQFAISPKATFDTLSNEFVAELPIYFIPRKESQFSPGLRLSYSSKTDEPSFGVFMRTSF
ncbi:hypothetical protein BXU08_09865 [Sphingomonas sp. LM7]|nr:hypothetical protein BXU08_09865 [Sphingomonas sp. LM7]